VYASVTMKPSFQLVPGESVFTIGSCFAREIERELVAQGFDLPMTKVSVPRHEANSAVANDILNKYIAHSMANELRWALDPNAHFPEQGFLELEDGMWHDPHMVHNLLPATRARVQERRNEVMEACQAARTTRVFIITLGLAEAWFDKHIGLYLNGAPPAAALSRYPDRFEMHVLSYQDIQDSLEDIHALLRQFGHPDFRILITVSPVPFKATFSGHDAITANTYSKAVQRAAVEAFVLKHPNVDYFPSFETVTMSERSASFMPDNIHVQREVVGRIVRQVVTTFLPGHQVATEEPAAAVSSAAAAPAAAAATADPVALYRRAVELARAADYVTASNILRNVCESFGDAASGVRADEFRLMFGVCLLRAKQTPAGEVEVRRSVELNPDNPRARYKHGLALARLKRPEDAIVAFNEAIRLDPNSAEFRWRLGVELLRVGDNAGALASTHHALRLDPGHAAAQRALAEMTASVEPSVKA
jgi:tetratricopeptide (TPR) repeat protein